MEIILTILLGIIASLISSLMFWILTFMYSPINIQFSKYIVSELHQEENSKEPNLRIRFVNASNRDLIDVKIKGTIRVNVKGYNTRIAILTVGGDSHEAIVRKKERIFKRISSKSQMQFNTKISTLSIREKALNEYKRDIYPEHIRKKAMEKTLKIEDIAKEYNDSIKIRIILIGVDRITGRVIFEEKDYGVDDIKEGKFASLRELWKVEGGLKSRIFFKKWIIKNISRVNEVKK